VRIIDSDFGELGHALELLYDFVPGGGSQVNADRCRNYGKYGEEAKAGHPAETGTRCRGKRLRGLSPVKQGSDESSRQQYYRPQKGRDQSGRSRTQKCSSRDQHADGDRTGILERNSRTRGQRTWQGRLNRGGRDVLRVYPGDIFLVLRLAAFMAEASVVGKNGSASTALLHTSSLR